MPNKSGIKPVPGLMCVCCALHHNTGMSCIVANPSAADKKWAHYSRGSFQWNLNVWHCWQLTPYPQLPQASAELAAQGTLMLVSALSLNDLKTTDLHRVEVEERRQLFFNLRSSFKGSTYTRTHWVSVIVSHRESWCAGISVEVIMWHNLRSEAQKKAFVFKLI